MGAIFDAIENKLGEVLVNAAMPGNKGKYKGDFSHDVTELDGLDNLQNPLGVIKESQDKTASIYGVISARYLVNGSSSGNLTMLFSYFKEGDMVLVERNCHKSVYNGLILRKLIPIFMYPKYTMEGIALPITLDEVKVGLNNSGNGKIAGVVLTTPTYSGLYCDLKKIYDYLKTEGISLIVDGAHGAHLLGMAGFENFYKSCDSMVVSAHKTMGCLNQGSIILNNKEDKTDSLLKYSNMFQTTSPSYLIMGSIEKSVEELNTGIYLKTRSLENIKNHGYKNFRILTPSEGLSLDSWKISLISQNMGPLMYDYLKSRGVYPEMVTKGSVLLMLSPYMEPMEIAFLGIALKDLDKTMENFPVDEVKVENKPETRLEKKFEMYDAFEKKVEYVSLEEAIDNIAGEMLIPYPPGVPLAVPGEILNKEVIDVLKWYMDNDIDIQGMRNDSIPVIKGE